MQAIIMQPNSARLVVGFFNDDGGEVKTTCYKKDVNWIGL